MLPETFHPAVAGWFRSAFAAPTSVAAQRLGRDRSRQHTLIAAPTGSGKTLAAFLGVIDLLEQRPRRRARDETRVLYVSPLKALVERRPEKSRAPLGGIRPELARAACSAPAIRAAVRTGDTPQSERARMREAPAAHPRHDAGVALPPADQRARAQHAAHACVR